MNDLKNLVVKWIYMLGMTGKVSDADIIANTQIIADLFPKLTLKQIELAIKLSMQGVLDVDTETYGTFSPLYISKIIKAYLVYSNAKIKELNWRKESIDKMETKQIELPYSVRLEQRKQTLQFYINHITTHNKYVGDFNNSMWEMLKRMNMLNPKELPLEEADKWANNKAILESQTIDAKQYAKLNPTQRQQAIETRQKLYARYFVMRNLFVNMKEPYKWLEELSDEIILPK
jgi:hypothetical protein